MQEVEKCSNKNFKRSKFITINRVLLNICSIWINVHELVFAQNYFIVLSILGKLIFTRILLM